METRLKLVSGIISVAVLLTFFFVACDERNDMSHSDNPPTTVSGSLDKTTKTTEDIITTASGTRFVTLPPPTASAGTTSATLVDTTNAPSVTNKPTATTTPNKTTLPDVPVVSVVPNGTEDQFYNDSVFVGNSIMLGFSNYAKKVRATSGTEGYLGSAKFFCGGSFGVYNNEHPIKDDSTHPIYQGQKYTVQDAVGVMGAKTVYLNLMGLNDLAMYGNADKCSVMCAQDMAELIEDIHSRYPDVKIVVLSATYLTKDRYYASLNNKNLSLLNKELLKYCNENGYDFVDIASAMLGSDGFLKNDYSSDDYCHLNKEGYQIWTNALYAYAQASAAGTYKNPSDMKILPAKP